MSEVFRPSLFGTHLDKRPRWSLRATECGRDNQGGGHRAPRAACLVDCTASPGNRHPSTVWAVSYSSAAPSRFRPFGCGSSKSPECTENATVASLCPERLIRHRPSVEQQIDSPSVESGRLSDVASRRELQPLKKRRKSASTGTSGHAALDQSGHERCSEQRSAAAAIQGGGPVDQRNGPAADRQYILPPRTDLRHAIAGSVLGLCLLGTIFTCLIPRSFAILFATIEFGEVHCQFGRLAGDS